MSHVAAVGWTSLLDTMTRLPSLLLLFASVAAGEECHENFCFSDDYQQWRFDPEGARQLTAILSHLVSRPFLVEHDFIVRDVKEVDTAKHQLTLDLAMFIIWPDSRLSCTDKVRRITEDSPLCSSQRAITGVYCALCTVHCALCTVHYAG
jgi:hypothetical protein